jgi:hypothetical protein
LIDEIRSLLLHVECRGLRAKTGENSGNFEDDFSGLGKIRRGLRIFSQGAPLRVVHRSKGKVRDQPDAPPVTAPRIGFHRHGAFGVEPVVVVFMQWLEQHQCQMVSESGGDFRVLRSDKAARRARYLHQHVART